MWPRLLIQQGPNLLATFTHKVRSGKESNTMEWKKKVANLCVFICYVRFDRFSCFVLFCFVFFQFTNICPLMLRRLSVRDDWGSETCHTIKFIDGLEKRTTSSVFVHVAITSWRVSNTLIKCLEKTTKAMFVTSSQWTPSDKEGASESYVIPKELLWCESLCTHVNTWYQNAVLIQLKHFQNQFAKESTIKMFS